ncbi:ribonuclease E inhibitor RraB [Pseudoduganella eburnea]|uniref:Ribonuclease E inhibitor RraB n=1 Tax=Massilia eburnea TaxID=1776165 RepID=A0A6L6QK59_9BURK|nr:ribonuclease E inhibitor RraB [Massilia eburnea]MTW12575.1 ribonuclease E inhibitor RraB [Massilia eburnea]
MNSANRFIAVLLAGLFLTQSADAQPGGTREELKWMYANISKKTKWDMSKDMLWGYFFTNRSRAPLDIAAKDLSLAGYRVVNVHLSDKEDSAAPDLWWLHVERIETHSIDSLLKRNAELAEFAKAHHLASYDGMDVGPVGEVKK